MNTLLIATERAEIDFFKGFFVWAWSDQSERGDFSYTSST